MTKPFRKRVVLYAKDKYIVQYVDYYIFFIFPVWTSLKFWFEQTLTGGTECWSLNMWKYDEAVKIAESLKSKLDVYKYYEPYEKKEADFYRRKSEYYKKNVPVSVKEID